MQTVKSFQYLKELDYLLKDSRNEKGCFISIGLLINDFRIDLTFLPVATVTVERAFSVMNIIKNRLRNRIGDQWMNDCLITYIEKDILKTIKCEEIMQ